MIFSSSTIAAGKHFLGSRRLTKLSVLALSALLVGGALFPAGVQALALGPNFTIATTESPGYVWVKADSANRGLIKNGYQGLAYIGPPYDPNSQFTRATIFHYLRAPHALGLYINTHGHPRVPAFNRYPSQEPWIEDGYGERITPRDIAAYNVKPWRFVFLDACYAGQGPDFANVFGIPGSTPQRAFLGWKSWQGQVASYLYVKHFFHLWGPGVRIDAANFEAKRAARAEALSYGLPYGYDRWDIALYGDGGYDGGAPL